jgi:hypothetical protein
MIIEDTMKNVEGGSAPYFKVLPQHSTEMLEGNKEEFNNARWYLTEIRTGYFPYPTCFACTA